MPKNKMKVDEARVLHREALINLGRVANKINREYHGTVGLTDPQVLEEVEKIVEDLYPKK